MNSKMLLRIAAFCVFVHLLGHLAGHLMWDQPEDLKLLEIVNQMKSYQANFMGALKSMADFYEGYSLIMFGLYVLTISFLWILSNQTITNSKLVKQLALPIAAVYLYFGIVEYLCFFPFAAAMSFLAGFLTLIASLKLKAS